ncbi:uncharacterized protein B0I36DRAFT_294726 [Microdochium trichocladiopsis]|uniref:DUF221-domain-containing protein n=1 Tax=Microdochium trichocladiopsis TaxID=1682393 RepID=A0A9P8Y159_9PEZI|nr:uncharacterized protein B0I36DRAFT_294726 [Microdochium trichocladiopsis]KAH7026600.1 hypothetical protein B0I36DRAFT_294726 [Microdochium trichocladiopsis]
MDGATWRHARALVAREDAGLELLDLLSNPFKSQITGDSVWYALGTSVGISASIAIAFSLLRPHNSVVYAPKLKHADEKHAPPPIGKGYLAWVKPLWSTTEKETVAYAGMDAAIFLRFTRMLRNLFLVLALVGCAILLPVYYSMNSGNSNQNWIVRLTPAQVWNQPIWATIVLAYACNLIICGFLWYNYRKVLQLRRHYYASEEYQNSLHARTLMMTDIPKNYGSDEGIARLIDQVAPHSSFSRTAMARNVKHLPGLISQHDSTVRKLEKVLAHYLKDPKNLPASRPMCYPSKKDPSYGTYPRGQKVDAIEYLTQRIRELEEEVKGARAAIDKRNVLNYGFASYDDIEEAHNIAYVCRKKKPHGATITLAPRPNDIIWDNMPISPATRRWRRFIINLWITVLTFLWIGPNAMIAVFLVNLNNLGLVWSDFQTSLAANPQFWAVVQGVLSPAVTSLVYLVLPIIFRRLSIRAGDRTKSGRERHVVGKLYAFFVFNNLIVFSLFSCLWNFVSSVVKDTTKGSDAWQAILKADLSGALLTSLCVISSFWINWLLQRNLGAAIDLAQLWTLVYSSFMRKFSSPTPREMIELTAPPPFDYASYYNYFLFYATVAFAFSSIQPLVLPAAALYFAIDVWLKKYLLLYIFVTKTESGGMFWRVLYNRLCFAVILSNLVVYLVTWERGDGTRMQFYSSLPLPLIMIIFKIYCAKTFDTELHYCSSRSARKNPEGGLAQKDPLRSQNFLAKRFGHPALYKPLITPMVHARAQNILAAVYKGRLTDGREAYTGDTMSTSGYSDAYVLDSMQAGKPGKGAAMPGFEIVPESRMDFEYYKNRPEFAAEHGGGDFYGRSEDVYRPGTPGSTWAGSDGGSRPSSPGFMPAVPRTASPAPVGRSYSPAPDSGTAYPGGYSRPLGSPYQAYTPPPPEVARSRSPFYASPNESGTNLVMQAAPMPSATPAHDRSQDRLGGRAPGTAGMLGGGPRGYGGLPQHEDDTPDHDPTQYDYFRGQRTRGNNSGAW